MMLAPQPAPVERTLNPDPQHRQRNIAEIQIASTLENNHDTELQVVIPPLKRTFHPTLSLQLNVTSPSLLSSPSSLTNACFQAVSGRQECFLLLRVKLPDEVFIDPDELDGKWGGKTRNRYWSRGRMESSVGGDMDIEEIGSGGVYDWLITPEKIDIERPVFTSNEDNIEPAGPGTKGGSAIAQSGGSVLDVMLPLRHKQKQEQRLDQDQEHGIPDELETEFLSLDIPLHGRYLAPSDDGEVEITVLSAEATDNGEAIPQGGSLHGMVGCASQSFVPQEIDVSRGTSTTRVLASKIDSQCDARDVCMGCAVTLAD